MEPPHHRAPSIRLSPDTDTLAPARVLDGYRRPYGRGPHMWCSDPSDKEPWLRLDWPPPATASSTRTTTAVRLRLTTTNGAPSAT